MKKVVTAILAGLALVCMMTGPARASLTTIGTATYGGSDYNLIWDNDNNGNSVVWLDYSNIHAGWSYQNAWAAGLNSSITSYNINPGFIVDWGSSAWRLPSTVDSDGPYVYGTDGTTTAGLNINTSEMGHLYYTELGNLGRYDTSGNEQSGYGLTNTGDFRHLSESYYWSGTEYAYNPGYAWYSHLMDGNQGHTSKTSPGRGLAVRGGQVSAVPVPGAIWLLGSGLIGLLGIRRRRKGNRIKRGQD